MSYDLFVSFGLPTLGSLLALVCLVFGLRAGKRQRLIDNLPVSKTTGVFIGLVDLQGTAETEQPLHSFLTATPCVYYHWKVEEQWSRTVTETDTDSDGKSRTRTRTETGWTTVAEGSEAPDFYLQDDCGVIRIQPTGAKIEPQTVLSQICVPTDALYYGKGPATAVANSSRRRKFVETAIQLHTPLYVMGQARERTDIIAAEIAADKKDPLFLISTRSVKAISRGFRLGFWLLGSLGLALALSGMVWRTVILQEVLATKTPVFGAIGLGYLLAWLLGWLGMAYNSLIDLRQRVRQAWANVDVELNRRHDLIPNLVNIVTGLRDYERTVQMEVSALRGQLTATPPGRPGPDPSGCRPAIRAVAEAYPELKANPSFLKLQQQLVETEQRIALARNYFNDIATFYNTRLQIIPDRFIAGLGGLQPQALLVATNFERAPVLVKFATADQQPNPQEFHPQQD